MVGNEQLRHVAGEFGFWKRGGISNRWYSLGREGEVRHAEKKLQA